MWTSVVCQKNSRPRFTNMASYNAYCGRCWCTVYRHQQWKQWRGQYIHSPEGGWGCQKFHPPRFVLHRQQAADTSQITDGGIKYHKGSESHPAKPSAGRGSPNGGRIQAHHSCYPTEAGKMAELGGSTIEEAYMECDLDHGKRQT
ncbi:hypothetical protein DPMN_113839 [Dreissena polymorpha]|uniref:Uncharacterized protein n=1 Tax=Dreissena polymorpha TaxID=45954 RepID=A0A9D4QR13_DREPO|nr:hypothetical protein DPMN_113839 [Dreissena polymorpha]